MSDRFKSIRDALAAMGLTPGLRDLRRQIDELLTSISLEHLARRIENNC